GPTIGVPEEGPFGILCSQPPGELYHAVRQGDRPLPFLPLRLHDGEDPQTLVRVEVAGLDRKQLLRPASREPGRHQEGAEVLVLDAAHHLVELLAGDYLLPTSRRGLLHAGYRGGEFGGLEQSLPGRPPEGTLDRRDGPAAATNPTGVQGQPGCDVGRCEASNQ